MYGEVGQICLAVIVLLKVEVLLAVNTFATVRVLDKVAAPVTANVLDIVTVLLKLPYAE